MSDRFQVFYDGDCPVNSREVRRLRKRDRGNRVQFTDITSPDFFAESYGKKHEDFMASIKGRKADGTWVEGADVLRHIYDTLGLKLAVRVSRAPVIADAVDSAYGWFERNRLRLTGRSDD